MVQERKWNVWVLSEGDITTVAEELGGELSKDQIEVVARLFTKGVKTLLGDTWEQILKDSIDEAVS